MDLLTQKNITFVISLILSLVIIVGGFIYISNSGIKDIELSLDWISLMSLTVNFVGFAFIAYQWREIQLKNDKDKEVQYLIKTVGDIAIGHASAYDKQMQLATNPAGPITIQEFRLLQQARDEFSMLHSVSASLQKAVNVNVSATEDSIDQMTINQKKQMELEGKAAVFSVATKDEIKTETETETEAPVEGDAQKTNNKTDQH